MHVSTIRLPLLIGTTAALLLYAAEPVSGQGFLRRLEERVRQRLEEGPVIPPPPPETGPLAPDRPLPANDRPKLGVEVDEVPNREGTTDVVVAGVHPNSAAGAAGLQPGDRITRFAGAPITSVRDLLSILQRSQRGDRLLMVVERDGQQVDLAVRLGTERGQNAGQDEFPPPSAPSGPGELPGPASPTGEAESVPPSPIGEPEPSPEASGRLGLTVEDPRSTRGRTLTRGAQVVEVVPGGPGAEAGLRVGDTIVSLDGTLIPDAESMILQMRRTRPGQRIELQYVRDQELGRVTVTLAGADDTAGKRSEDGRRAGPPAPRETASRNAADPQTPSRVPSQSGLGALGSVFGGLFGGETGGEPADAAAPDDAATHTCPMHPQIQHAGAGKCPICGMRLTEIADAPVNNANTGSVEAPGLEGVDVLPSPNGDVPPSLENTDVEDASPAELQETIRRLEATNRRLESRLRQLEERMQAILQATADEE